MNSLLQEFLKRPVAYQPIVAKAFGSVKLAILWCQLYYWNDKSKDGGGWIYKTREEIFDETALGRKEQETARKIGAELGVMESERRGRKGVMNYRINMDKAVGLIEEYVKNNPSKKQETREAVKVEAGNGSKEIKNESAGLPEWLDKKAWEEWTQHRKEIKHALTPSTAKKQIAFLEKFKADHVEMIQNSIRNGWQGLFELKPAQRKQGVQPQEKICSKCNKPAESMVGTGKDIICFKCYTK